MDELLEDQGELGDMKRKYASELGMLKDMFPDWTEVDLVFALQETDGDVPATVDHITQGSVSQFAEVKKTKDRARSRVKEDASAAGATDRGSVRGGRGRGGAESARGGRGRGSDRGRGGFRGGRGGHATTNGAPKDTAATSVPTTESSAWDTPAITEAANGGWDTAAAGPTKEASTEGGQSASGTGVTAEGTPAAASEGMKSSLIPESGPKKSWASMFSQLKPAPVPAPAKQAPAPSQAPSTSRPPAELVAQSEVPAAQEMPAETHTLPEPESEPAAPQLEEPVAETMPEPSPSNPPSVAGADVTVAPSKVPLTEENVEHLPDESHAPATHTAASTVGSVDTRNLTPLSTSQPGSIGSRPPIGGFAASAHRAAGLGGRSASFQRRVQEQQEAVVMPGHNAVDRAAVQFGSMGLNGEPGPDVDEDREEPETQQALQHSPPSQPRTSLPPAPAQAQEASRPTGLPTPKQQPPGLPPASQQNQQQIQEATMAPGLTQDQAQPNPNYNQYAQYGQTAMQQDSGAQQQKPYDPYGQQAHSGQYDPYGTRQPHSQPMQHQPGQGGFGALSSAPSDYQSYYTSNDQQRNAYNQYYGGYAPQDGRGQTGSLQQDAGLGQQRSASGFGAGPNESAYASQAQQQVSSLSFQEQQAHPPLDQQFTAFPSSVKPLTNDNISTSVLPGSRTAPHRSPAIRSEAQANGSVESAFDTLNPLQDVSNRQLRPLYTSAHPKTFYSPSYSNHLSEQAQSRFSDAPGSGHNTPNPLLGGQQQHQQQQAHGQHQSVQQQQQQQHAQQGGYGQSAGYPYGHPYYQSPYQQAYQNQFGFSQHLGGGYGGQAGGYPGGGKQGGAGGGMYGAPAGYGHHSAFDQQQHSASPANSSAFGQNQQGSMRAASGMSSGLGGGLDDYARSSAQATSQHTSGFGGMNDPFARSASGLGGYGQQQQQGLGDEGSSGLKPYAGMDPASKSGPSPALGQPGRPGSAANSNAGSSGLPPPQQAGQQSAGFGGYPGFPGQGSQYGSLGGLGSHQQGQNAGMGGQGGYGQYGAGAGGFSQYGGGYGSQRGGGGWGANYGAH